MNDDDYDNVVSLSVDASGNMTFESETGGNTSELQGIVVNGAGTALYNGSNSFSVVDDAVTVEASNAGGNANSLATGRIALFDLGGRRIEGGFEFGPGGSDRVDVRGLDVDDDRRLWVADAAAGAVRGFNVFGREGLRLGPRAPRPWPPGDTRRTCAWPSARRTTAATVCTCSDPGGG